MNKKIFLAIAFVAVIFVFGCVGAKKIPLRENKSNMVVGNNTANVVVNTPVVKDIDINYFTFHPNILKISPGTTVVWKNQDDDVIYEVVSGHIEGYKEFQTNLFDSGEMGYGNSFNYTFDKEGDYPFYLKGHVNIQGIIIVGNGNDTPIEIRSPHFVGSTPPHNKTLDSLNEIWITFNAQISNQSTITVYDVKNHKIVEPTESGVDISNNLRLFAKFNSLEPSEYKVEYYEVIGNERAYGQFFFDIAKNLKTD